tara:strand:- start:2979 stop:3716 length:738 start_codon:yes stop_codon:yes gene_type:complete
MGRMLERIYMPQALSSADSIIAVSRSTQRDIVEYCPEARPRIQVIHAAAFLRPERSTITRERGRHLLFVGTFEPRKNLSRLLEAYAALVDRMPAAPPLVLAGTPGWKVNIRSLVERHELGSRVRIVERPSDRDLAELYAAAEYLVMPSLYEGFGLPIVESMSFGKPVITSDVSSMPEVAGSAALLVDPLNVFDISEKMYALLNDRDLHRRLSEHASKQAEAFSWDRAAMETLNVLEAAGARRSRD